MASDQDAFYSLNEAWINKYFAMESKDEYSLRNPKEAICAAADGSSWLVRATTKTACQLAAAR